MRKVLGFGLSIVFTTLLASTTLAAPKGLVHGIVITVDGTDYYLLGLLDGPNGERDIPSLVAKEDAAEPWYFSHI